MTNWWSERGSRNRQPNLIRCSGRASLVGTWIFGIMLTGFVWILWMALLDQPPEWMRELDLAWLDHAIVAMTVLAGIVTVAALAAALLATRDWRLLGPAHLALDPYPPGIGGEIGGVMTLQARPAQLDECVLALQCIRRRRNASSSRNTSWHETVLWETEGLPHIDDAGRTSRVVVRFPLPDGQPASFSETNEQIVWRLHLEVNVKGRQLHRTFTVPVGDEPTPPRTLQRYPLTPDRPVSEEDLPRAWVRESRDAGRVQFFFPPFRHLKAILSLAIISALVFGVPGVIMLWMRLSGEGPPIAVPVVLLLFAFLLILPVLWLPLSRRITASRDGLQFRQAWFGLPLGSWSLAPAEIERFSHDSGKQIRFGERRQEVFYHVFVHTPDGRKKRCSGDLPGPVMTERYEQRLREALDSR